MSYKEFQKKELGLGLNAFNRPVEYSGIKAWVKSITELLFTIPGTYSTDPELGVGVQTYRYTFFENTKDELESKINKQVRTYLPDIPLGSVNATCETVNNIPILVLKLIFRVSENDLKTAWVAVDNSNKTLNYEVSF